MKTIQDFKDFKARTSHPLTLDGMNVYELSQVNPAEAHRLVARAVGEKGHRAWFNHRERQSCIAEAMQKPLPGAAADAFLNGALKVNGRKVYEVVPTHIKCLQAVDSPLLKMGQAALETNGSADGEITEEQEWELCYIFTTPPRELRKMLKDQGVKFIKEKAEEIWGECSAAEIRVTCEAALNQFGRHFQTTAKFEAEMEASGDVSFFRELKIAALKAPATAGS